MEGNSGGGGRRGGGKPFYASPLVIGDKIVAVSRRQGTFIYPRHEVREAHVNVIAGDDTDFNATPP